MDHHSNLHLDSSNLTSSVLADRLRRAGQRVTPQRLVILGALIPGGHLAADEVFARVESQLPGVNRSTVYRTLELFSELGLVSVTDLGGGARQYELLEQPHHHLICHRCGGAIEMDDHLVEPLREAIRVRYGFAPQVDHLALFGFCAYCQNLPQQQTEPQMPSDFPTPVSAVTVREITRLQPAEADDLCEVLAACVNDGASLGFHAPLSHDIAQTWWSHLPRPGVTLLVAEADGHIGGTVQLHGLESANGAHRVEIAKLLVHPAWRRRGVASTLMHAAEDIARKQGRLLIVLDTREGDPSNLLYQSVGYTQGGRIPDWARDAAGDLTATIFWYKQLV